MFAEYHERLAKPEDNLSALIKRFRIRSVDQFEEKWNNKMAKWSQLVVNKAEKQERIKLGQDLGLSDDEEKISRSSNEYSLIDNSFDTQNEKEKTAKAADQAVRGWLETFDKNLLDIDLNLDDLNFDFNFDVDLADTNQTTATATTEN